MRNFFCLNFHGNPVDNIVRDCIITGARWLKRHNKQEVIISNRDEGIRVVVKTDFRVQQLGQLSGFAFFADYARDGVKGEMAMILPTNVLNAPEDEEDVWIVTRLRLTFKEPKPRKEPAFSKN